MKYIVCEKPGQFLLKEKEAPYRKQGEALVKISQVGICGTDLHAYQGNQAFFTYPRILGHELAAEVLEIEDNPKKIKRGDHVVVMPYLSCNQCIACRNGKTNCCTSLKVLGIHTDGGMQELLNLPIELLVPAKNLNDVEMALVEPLAIGAHAVKRASLTNGDTVVVVGCGPIGIGIMKLAQLEGATVIAVDTNAQRLDFVKNKIGIAHTVLSGTGVQEDIKSITDGDLAQVVFDATGHKGALESGPSFMAHGGSYVLVGLSKGDLTFHHPAIHAKEATIRCSRNATMVDFEQVISMLQKGDFPVNAYVTHQVHFGEMINNFDRWLQASSGVIKAMVAF
jgi:2-desacetyl-2-hydroxyethyl bacteriochlorophyllide A dehydrogenase